MKLYNLLVLLSANIEHVTKILVQRQQVFIHDHRVYDMRLYGNIPQRIEVQFSKKYGSNEDDFSFDKIKNDDIEITLDSQAKREIIMVILWDDDQDEITI